MATFYRTGVETYSIIGAADERDSLEGRIPDGSTYFAVDENMFYTFYDGTWYETLPEAARLYHDDVGTDTKPIKLVGGVATVVANELAEDSKVVHKTGNESIGGSKTFTQNILVKKGGNSYVEIENTSTTSSYGGFLEKSAYLVTGDTVKTVGEFIATRDSGTNNRSRVLMRTTAPNGSTASSVTAYSYDDGTIFAECPTFTADNSADDKIVTRSMLAQTPTVVHTTGNEEIAGTKTFTGAISTAKDLGWCRTYTHTVAAGSWVKVYEVKRVGNSGGLADIYNDFAMDSWRDIEMYWGIGAGSGGYHMSGAIYGNVTSAVNRLAGVMARRASDNVAEIWIGNAQASGNINLVIDCKHIRSEPPIPSEATGEKPVVGSTYSEVVDMNVY